MTPEEISEILGQARVLLKMYDIDAKVTRHRWNREREYVLGFGGTRWVRGWCNHHSRRESHWKVITYKTPEALLNGVKRLVNKVNINDQ
jgi:hypothetical protein